MSVALATTAVPDAGGAANHALSRLLLLADSRTPTGAHAHSGGVEQAITRGMVSDTPSLQWFIQRRLATAGLLAAAAAAAACRAPGAPDALAALDAGVEIRTPSGAQREASRNQGRGLRRLARRLPVLLPDIGTRPHHPVMLGALAGALGVPDRQAAAVAAQLTAAGIAGAAQRLLALDPLEVTAGLVELADAVDRTAAAGAAADALPDLNDPLADLLAEEHYARKDRFFVS
jgi:urease accessory protein